MLPSFEQDSKIFSKTKYSIKVVGKCNVPETEKNINKVIEKLNCDFFQSFHSSNKNTTTSVQKITIFIFECPQMKKKDVGTIQRRYFFRISTFSFKIFARMSIIDHHSSSSWRHELNNFLNVTNVPRASSISSNAKYSGQKISKNSVYIFQLMLCSLKTSSKNQTE